MAKWLGVAQNRALDGSNMRAVTGAAAVFQSLTPASVAAATCAEQTFAVPNVQVGDIVSVTPPSITAGVAPVCARVSVNGTLAITFINPTAGAVVPAAGIYRLSIIRA